MSRILKRAVSPIVAALLAGSAGTAQAAAFVFTTDAAYTQNFNTLSFGPEINFTSLPAGVAISEGGTTSVRLNQAYAANNGSETAGDIYSYGSPGFAERALGTLRSGTLFPLIGFVFTNDTGRTITALDVAFTGELWRLGAAGRTDRLDFQYGVGTNSLTAGSFIDVDALDFVTPSTAGTAGQRNGNTATFRTLKSGSIGGLSIADGQSFVIRFQDFNPAGSDDGLAIDDFSLTPTLAVAAVPEPSSWAMMIGGFALIGAAMRRRVRAFAY